MTNEVYQPSISVWKLIQANVPEFEQDEMKSLLGESLIEQSLDLHEEISMLLEIWQDYRKQDETQNVIASLPEPPGLRETLIQEICFLAGNLREKLVSSGQSSELMLSRHNSTIIDYALSSNSEVINQATTRHEMSMKSTDCRISSASSSRVRTSADVTEMLGVGKKTLSALHLDDVINHLKETLQDEVQQLQENIVLIQTYLDNEVQSKCNKISTPTISDLREERNKLEKSLNQEELFKPKQLATQSPSLTSNRLTPLDTTVTVLRHHKPSHQSSIQTQMLDDVKQTQHHKVLHHSVTSDAKDTHKNTFQRNVELEVQPKRFIALKPGDCYSKHDRSNTSESENDDVLHLVEQTSVSKNVKSSHKASVVAIENNESTELYEQQKNSHLQRRLVYEEPSHVVIRTRGRKQTSPGGVVVSVEPSTRANIAVDVQRDLHAFPLRPTSAHRLRQIVMDCRNNQS